jgi:hypothetical protein
MTAQQITLIAHNKLIEFYRKKLWLLIPGTILIFFVAPLWYKLQWANEISKDNCSAICAKEFIEQIYNLTFFLEYGVIYFIAAFALKAEIDRKSMLSVMLTSISKETFFTGKIIGILLIHGIFSTTIIFTHIIAANLLKAEYSFIFYVTEFINHLFYGLATIIWLTALSMIMPAIASITTTSIIFILPSIIRNISNNIHPLITQGKLALYYLLPATPEVKLSKIFEEKWNMDQLVNQFLLMGSFLSYAIALFIICIWLSRDKNYFLKS